jgi:hypothetical protein
MAKWPTPYKMESKLANRSERRGYSRVQVNLRQCKYCMGVFSTREHRDDCERTHVALFRAWRKDARDALGKIEDQLKGDVGTPAVRRQLRRQLVRLERKLREFPRV